MLEETFLKLTIGGWRYWSFERWDPSVGSGPRSSFNVYSVCKELLLCCAWLCVVCLRLRNHCLLTALQASLRAIKRAAVSYSYLHTHRTQPITALQHFSLFYTCTWFLIHSFDRWHHIFPLTSYWLLLFVTLSLILLKNQHKGKNNTPYKLLTRWNWISVHSHQMSLAHFLPNIL